MNPIVVRWDHHTFPAREGQIATLASRIRTFIHHLLCPRFIPQMTPRLETGPLEARSMQHLPGLLCDWRGSRTWVIFFLLFSRAHQQGDESAEIQTAPLRDTGTALCGGAGPMPSSCLQHPVNAHLGIQQWWFRSLTSCHLDCVPSAVMAVEGVWGMTLWMRTHALSLPASQINY